MASHGNMGSHIMKTTIEIADDLLERAQQVARKEGTTLRSLAEQGLRLVLKERRTNTSVRKWKPITRGGGLNPEFKDWSWDKIRDLIYEGR
jgi:predicted transcriptional regulator